jgi:hypothetical protein
MPKIRRGVQTAPARIADVYDGNFIIYFNRLTFEITGLWSGKAAEKVRLMELL